VKCPNCEHETDDAVCPECGTTIVSVVDDTMDSLVESASVPNLAALFKQGKKRGLIKAQQDYGQTA